MTLQKDKLCGATIKVKTKGVENSKRFWRQQSLSFKLKLFEAKHKNKR